MRRHARMRLQKIDQPLLQFLTRQDLRSPPATTQPPGAPSAAALWSGVTGAYAGVTLQPRKHHVPVKRISPVTRRPSAFHRSICANSCAIRLSV